MASATLSPYSSLPSVVRDAGSGLFFDQALAPAHTQARALSVYQGLDFDHCV